MANLSNINDIFKFTDGEFLLIGGATANSINATETGIAVSNATAASLSLQNTTEDTGNNFTLFSSSDGSFKIRDVGVGAGAGDRFSISADGAATFTGSITVSGISSTLNTGNSGTFVTNDSSGYPRITTSSASVQLGLFRSGTSAGGMYIGANSGGLEIMTSAFATKFSLDNSGNGIFSGSVTATNFIGTLPTGQFLPLSGGTLTGPLVINGSNSLTVGGHFNANSTTTLGGAVTIEGNLFMDNYNITSVNQLNFDFTSGYIEGSSTNVNFNGLSVKIGIIDNAVTDTDKFLVSEVSPSTSSGEIKYRTGAQVLSDIGAAPATGGAYLPLAGGTLTGPLTGTSATFSGNITAGESQSGTSFISATNTNSGVSATARLRAVGESSQIDIIATSAGYTGVTGWADAGIISTDSGASGGLILNSVAGVVKLQTSQTTAVTIDTSQNATFAGQVLCDTNTTTPAGGEAVFYKSSAGAVLSGYQAILETGSGGSRATALTLDSDQDATFVGAVGVGVNGGSNAKLEVVSTSGEVFRADVASGAYRIVANQTDVLLNGNVGIGTGTPDEKLVVNGAIGLSYNGTNSYQGIKRTSVGNEYYCNTTSTGTHEIHTFTGSSGTKKLTILESGNVGIGTDSPSYLLTAAGTNLPYIASVTASVQTVIASDETNLRAYIGTRTNHPIAFVVDGNEKMRIDSSGIVGIGSTGIYAGTSAQLNLPGKGLAIKNDKNGSDNNWSYIENTATNSESNINFYTGNNAAALTLAHNGDATFDGNVKIGSSTTGTPAANADDLVIDKGASESGITLISTAAASIRFGDAANTSIGSIEYNHNSNYLRFSTDNAERMRIDSSGNVGIGTDDPGSYDGESDDLVIFNSTTPGITIATDDAASRGALRFADGTSGNAAYIGGLEYNHNGDYMLFRIAGTEKMRLTSGGDVILKSGAANTGASLIFNELSIPSWSIGNPNGANSHFAITDEYNSAERMRITSGGDVLMGTTATPNGTSVYGSGFIDDTDSAMVLKLASSTTVAKTLIEFLNANGSVGSIQTSGTSTSYLISSDYRLKEDLQDFNGLDKISKIKMYDYKWKSGNDRSYGAMAHELQEIIPYAVSGEKDGEDMQGVDYSKVVPLLVKSIQEQQKQIEELKQIIKNK